MPSILPTPGRILISLALRTDWRRMAFWLGSMTEGSITNSVLVNCLGASGCGALTCGVGACGVDSALGETLPHPSPTKVSTISDTKVGPKVLSLTSASYPSVALLNQEVQ